MRRDGDILVEHLASAREAAVICAPFIKAKVLRRILDRLDPSVEVEIATRWIPAEVAAGVSDLEVYDIVNERPRTTLKLIDNLHAKIFVADMTVLTGSTNVTARAFGWCNSPNLEVLVPAEIEDPAIRACLSAVELARVATESERARVLAESESLVTQVLPEAVDFDVPYAGVWLPRFGAPQRLYAAYRAATRDRLSADNLEAADHDLAALALPAGLDETAFGHAVRESMAEMPGVQRLLEAADNYLEDSEGERIVSLLNPGSDLKPDAQWTIFREWLTYFFNDVYEIAPQVFVVRPRTAKS